MNEQTHPTPIVDSHLDLAENVTFCGRDLTLSVAEIREREKLTEGQATVSLPELQRGGIAVVFGTIYAGRPEDASQAHTRSILSSVEGSEGVQRSQLGIYASAEEAEANALEQIELYETWQQQGYIRLIKSIADLDHHLDLWKSDRVPGLVMLMEGADPIVHVKDLPKWWNLGLRMIGLSWGDTKYGSGMRGGSFKPRPGGLTAEGEALLEEMAEIGFIWDVSHLTEEGILKGLARNHPRVCASHCNARALAPMTRHLSDDIIRAIADREGVIGVILSNEFLDVRWKQDHSIRITLDHVRQHAEHMAKLGGWGLVGIGSDLDGGTGLEESPEEINTIADLHKVGCIAPEEHREAVLGTNWLRFLRKSLPRNS